MNPAGRQGFTLTELLVVIGIIVLLVGILLPMVMRAYRGADRQRTASDLNAIAVALDAYKADFGDYPRPAGDHIGFAILGYALIGPANAAVTNSGSVISPPTYDSAKSYGAGDMVQSGGNTYVCIKDSTGVGVTTTTSWQPFPWADGADGPGFKNALTVDSNGDGIPDVPGGKTWGPYLQPDKFKLRGAAILDRDENAILYFPGNKSANVSNPNTTEFVALATGTTRPMFAVNHNAMLIVPGTNTAAEQTLAIARMRSMSGDFNLNGRIDGGESAGGLKPYLLWAAGADRKYGPQEIEAAWLSGSGNTLQANSARLADVRKAIQQCDDVTNFNITP